jgi:RNA polymerase-interacting CarD/CdnL/TRCF family regulator
MLNFLRKIYKAAYEKGLEEGRRQMLEEEILRQELITKNDLDFQAIKRLLASYEKPEPKKIKYEETDAEASNS